MNENAETLPGLSHSHTNGIAGPLLLQARTTIQALEDAGRLQGDAGAALTAQLVLSLAEAVDRGLGSVRVSVSTATLARQLQDAIAALPAAAAGDDDAAAAFWSDMAKL